MLYPKLTATRNLYSLDGFWSFAPDYNNEGELLEWHKQLQGDREISVLASWNEQYQDLMHYFGVGWYERTFTLPAALQDKRLFIRIGAANYLTTLWINGKRVGEHEGGHLRTSKQAKRHRESLSIAKDYLPVSVSLNWQHISCVKNGQKSS